MDKKNTHSAAMGWAMIYTLNLKRFKLVLTMMERNDGRNHHFPSLYRVLSSPLLVGLCWEADLASLYRSIHHIN